MAVFQPSTEKLLRAISVLLLAFLLLITLAANAAAAGKSLILLFDVVKTAAEGPISNGLSSVKIAVVSLCVFQGLLIAGLLINRGRRRRAAEVREHQAAIVKSTADAILSEDTDGTITGWNAGAEGIFGYSSREIIGRHVSTLAPPESKEEVSGISARIGNQESLRDLETVRVAKDGRRIHVSLTISPIRNQNGIVTGASTIGRDITNRKQAEEARRESDELFHLMADTLPLMIWVAGSDTLCTFFNQRWLEFRGRTMEQEMGNGWVEGVHPEDVQSCSSVYLSSFNARRAFTMEYRLKRADGQYRWIVDTAVPRLLPDGNFAGYIGSCLDIGERKQQEQDLHSLSGRLILLQDEERQRVAAALYDGLGQSLAIIKNRALIGLRDQTNQGPAMEQLEEISATATAAILEVREIAYNLRPYELDRLGLHSAIESMVERISKSTPIFVSAKVEPIEGLLSMGAETSVYRIVQEALNNVVKHANATSASIEIKTDGRQLTITIQDNGAGIPAASSDNGNNNRGFGLAGIAERVRVLGGTFAIESHPTSGTILTVRLESHGSEAK